MAWCNWVSKWYRDRCNRWWMGRISRFHRINSSKSPINNRTTSPSSRTPLRVCLARCRRSTNNISSTRISSSSYSSSNSRIMTPLVCHLPPKHLLKHWWTLRWWCREFRPSLRRLRLRCLCRSTLLSWHLRINSSILSQSSMFRALLVPRPSDRKCCNTSCRWGMHYTPRPTLSLRAARML